MKYEFSIQAILLKAKVNIGKDGKSYYSLVIDVNDDVGNPSCTEDVYKLIINEKLQVYKPYIFICSINDSFPNSKVRIIGIEK